MASRTAACAFSLAGTIGSRSVLAHFPISESAYLIGAGLVSTNRLMCNGASLSCSFSAAAKHDPAAYYIEPKAEMAPLLEQSAFFLAACLAKKDKDQLEQEAQECKDRWQKLP